MSKGEEMADWVLVVDDDASNLRMAMRVLGAEGMRASCVKSGGEAIEFLRANKPDLVLLDIHMPGMSGFQTAAAIRGDAATAGIPIVFLTADEDNETEIRALEAGAMDFIKKPFAPAVLLLRVRHTIDLIRLQNELSSEVQKQIRNVIVQSEKLRRMSVQVIAALAEAIDAKDEYTRGHSGRVASYSQEIARRAGRSEARQHSIYMAGLLHDMGKIGIPDAVLNKPSSLTDSEYELIKSHPVIGWEILGKITELADILPGIRNHHERYDGKGYPDGLKGNEIPEIARIIAVADAYDAMTSRRKYSGITAQGKARAEVEAGKGAQFDPFFADIMLEIIDEDKDFNLKEQ